MFVGGRAQVAPDALGNQRQDVGARPAECPGQQCSAQEAGQVQRDQFGVDGLAVLERDQHVIHQRHGQIRGDQCGGGRGQREQEAGKQLPAVGMGEAP